MDNKDVKTVQQLRLLYEEVLYCVNKITELIDNKFYEDIEGIVTRRSHVLQDIASLKRSYGKALPEKFDELAEKIKLIDRENVKRLEQLKAETASELEITKNKSKVLNAYSGLENTSGEILDYNE